MALRLCWFMVYRARNITFGVRLSWFLRLCWFMVYRTRNTTVGVRLSCNNEMHAPYVLSIRTVSNNDGLCRTYGPLTALNGP